MNRAQRRATGAPHIQKRSANASASSPLRVLWASNAPFAATGYGTQTAQVTRRMTEQGHQVAVACNYGLEGGTMEWNGIYLYPRGMAGYSEDVMQAYWMHWASGAPDKPNALFTLYDAWVYVHNESLKKVPRIYSWVPIDHQPAPPLVLEWCKRDNVTPIVMSKFGRDMLALEGIECEYIPHAIEKTFTPTPMITTPIGEQTGRALLGIGEDAFVVMMNSANKGQTPCRKAFGQAILAFSIFALEHPDAMLYLHTEDHGAMGGINLPELLKAASVKPEQVRFVDQFAYRIGIPQETLAAFYTMADVLLCPSMGEGFGIPVVEAQACGTRVIVSDFTAQPELVGDGWTVAGQPEWDAAQKSWFFTPHVASIIDALNAAYAAPRDASAEAIAFAAEYDADKVYDEAWKPLIKRIAA